MEFSLGVLFGAILGVGKGKRDRSIYFMQGFEDSPRVDLARPVGAKTGRFWGGWKPTPPKVLDT